MSLTFTDAQIQNLTQQVIDAPVAIAKANASLAAITAQQAKDLATDNQNAVYTNDAANVINQYQIENQYLTGTASTPYNTANVSIAGQLLDGIHFPKSPFWAKMQPKLDASNQGLPTSAWTQSESEATTRATTAITNMQNGFTSAGTGDTTLTGPLTAGEYPITDDTGFAVNDTVLISQLSNYVFGTISHITVTGVFPTQTFSIAVTVTSSSGTVTTGAAVTNHKAGYTVSQIETTSSDPYLNSLEAAIDLGISDWKTRLNAELTALTANDSIAESAQITTAKANINTRLTAITTWQARPATGVGLSRFGTHLPDIQSQITGRTSEATTRAGQITTALGSVTQASDGTYSGSGWYYTLFDNLNTRLNLAGGSLRQYYQDALGITVFEQQIATLTTLQARNNATFTIDFLSVDATNTDIVTLMSVAGLTIGDQVKIMSSALPTVLTANILNISGLVVTLSIIIPNTYKAADHGRVVKQN